jgi:hypothetical protein
MDKRTNKNEVIAAPIPEDTKSYKAIPNRQIIETLEESLADEGYRIYDEYYEASKHFNHTVGKVTIDNGNEDMMMNLSWINSYNKTKRFAVALGARVNKCDNLDFSHFREMRKHTKYVWEDFYSIINSSVANISNAFDQIAADYKTMKDVPLYNDKVPELIGQLFHEQEIITANQVSDLSKNVKFQNKWNCDTMHDFFMHTTDALKSTHPSDMVGKHMDAHKFMMEVCQHAEPAL